MSAKVEYNRRVQLRNILFATDFSENSMQVVQYAMAVARHYESRIVVTHVLRPDAYQVIPQDPTALSDWFRREAEQQMANLLVSGVLRGVPHEVVMRQGNVWEALSEVVEEKEIDLIVLGTHGRTGVGKVMLGSVAEEIFRHANCPVMTVGPHVLGTPIPEANFQRIVYATDATREPGKAAAYALSLAQEFGAKLTILHAVRKTPGVFSSTRGSIQEEFIHSLKKFVPPEADSWCEPDFVVRFGEPAAEILDISKGRHADLIVLGVHGDIPLAGHRPATVAYKVLCEANCPVLTVKEEKSDESDDSSDGAGQTEK